MKKTFFVFIIIVIINTNVFSQDLENKNVDRKFTFQASPLLLLIDLISLGNSNGTSTFFIIDFESQYKINEVFNISFTVSFLINNHTINAYYYTENYSYKSYKEDTFQMNFKPMLVYRPFRTGLKGFYIGFYPNIGWQSLKNEIYGDELWTEIGIGINTGYKWVFNNGFTLQLGTGIGKTWSIPERPEDYFYPIPVLDFKLGYSL
ncbi:MAG: DUF3575 domain-containing protein [Treponema sp.]|jgi:hypothetical protein|nr:DUF3575 domain-containing protein [Treponema sp.]